MNLVRIFDKNHNDLTKFRISAIEECGGRAEQLTLTGSYKDIINKLEKHGAHRPEDIYRFIDEKWNRTNFDHVDVNYADDGNITNISGALVYNNWMRGAIYHFGLRKYSKQYPTILFRHEGQLGRLMEYSKNKKLDGIFISIYPHEKRLETLCHRLKENKGIPTAGDIDLIRLLNYRGNHMFNNVLQEFFAIEFSEKKFDINDIK